MPSKIVFGPARVLAFINTLRPLEYTQGMQGIGLERDGELVAGIIYEGYNENSIWAHIAAEPGSKWLNKEYLRFCTSYAFHYCRVNMILGTVEASNLQALRFAAHLGFKEEARVRQAAADGGDILILKMRLEDCRYMKAGV